MIHLLTTGGTIASAPSVDGRNVSGTLTGDDLAATLASELPSPLQPVTESLLQRPSNAIDTGNLQTIESRCRALLARGDIDGLVLTHGTDTLEDTAFYLHLTLGDCAKPIVLTGSQRALHETGSDAARNLADAIRVAAEPASRGQGVLVVFDQEVHSAALARKDSSYRLRAFNSPGFGPLGQVDHGVVHYSFYTAPTRGLPSGPSLPRVDMLHAGAGSTSLILAAQRDGADGLVIGGLGRGHVPPDWMHEIEQVRAAGLPVAITSSTASGPVRAVYEFPGSLAALLAAGVMPAGALSTRQARILLMLLLSRGHRDTDLAGQFCRASAWGSVGCTASPGPRSIPDEATEAGR